MVNNKKDWRHAAYQLGSILLVVGALTPFFVQTQKGIYGLVGNFVYLIGAALFLLAFISSPIKNLSIRQRRVYRMNVLTGAFFLVSSLLRMWRTDGLWMIFMGIAVGYMLYAMVLLVTGKKEKNDNEKE